MKNILRIIGWLACFLFSNAVYGTQLSPNEALLRVNTKRASSLKSAKASQMQLVRTLTDSVGNNVLYIFRNSVNGRLSFVSADDCAKPLLGYTDGYVKAGDSLPAALEEWLMTYTRQISYGIKNPDKLRPFSLPAVRNNGLKSTAKMFPSIDVLLPVEWGTIPFNGLCPEVNGVHTKVGCVAVAMYQIMCYWQYPAYGRDTVMYQSKLAGKDTVFQHSLEGSVYDWEALNDLTSEKGKAAAAILGRDCAYSVHATFGVDNTSARSSNVPKALTRYFGYDSSMVCVGRSDDDMWFRIIYNELANGRPVFYAGQGSYGHAFVCDGYNATDTTFHFNFDWYGSCNGFFSLSAINPDNGDQFNELNMAVIGIQPPGTFKKGSQHVFAYGDFTVAPVLEKRAGCRTLSALGASTSSSDFGTKGIFFAPPVYSTSNVALLMVNDVTKDTLLMVTNFGKQVTNVAAMYEYGLFKAFDFVALDNNYKFFSVGPTYSVALVYQDFPNEPWRFVEFANGEIQWAKIRFTDSGVIAPVADSVSPMITTDLNAHHGNTVFPADEYGNVSTPGYDATAIGQMVLTLQAPPMVFGDILYDNFVADTTYYFNFNAMNESNTPKALYYIGKAIRNKFQKRSVIHSVPAMVYGLHRNMGLPEVQYASRKFYTSANWIEMLDQNLQLGCPVYYAGYHILGKDSTRRAFVVDGYNKAHSYHVNFCDGGVGDKYLNLDVVRYSGSTPGNTDMCFPYGQGMLTDFFTSCSLDTVNVPKHPFMLMSPLVVNGDSTLTTLSLSSNEKLTLRFKLADCTKETTGYDADATVTVGVGIFRSGVLMKVLASAESPVSQTYHTLTFSIGSLMSGSYELALVTKEGAGKWERVFNNAPNTIPLTAKQNKLTLSVPFNPSFGARLALNAPMEVISDSVKGLMAHLPLSNYTNSNYEDILRLVVKVDGQSVVSDVQPVAVYGVTNMTYDIILPENLVEAIQKGGTLLGYYYKADEGWLPLQEETATPLNEVQKQTGKQGVSVYSASGVLLRTFAPEEISTDYAAYLSNLSVGVYVVVENGVSRKFVKYNK